MKYINIAAFFFFILPCEYSSLFMTLIEYIPPFSYCHRLFFEQLQFACIILDSFGQGKAEKNEKMVKDTQLA